MINKSIKILFVFLLTVNFAVLAGDIELSPAGSVKFQKKDVIKVGTYNWPETLVNYHVKFSGNIESESLVLTDLSSRKEIPFQLSDKKTDNGQLVSATVSFITALSSGGEYNYELKVGANTNRRIDVVNPVIVRKQDKSLVVGHDQFKVLIPASQNIGELQAPAPVISAGSSDRLIGDNILSSRSKKITSITTEELESGKLFSSYKISYAFEGGAQYIATVKIVSGYPFAIFEEEIDGLTKQDEVEVNMVWTGFSPRKRYGTQWDRVFDKSSQWMDIDKPVYTNYSQEDPRWTGMGWIEDPEKEMIFRLCPFGGNSVREQTPVMSFWEEGQNASELGIFVYDHNKWDDKQYGIWQPTPDLNVYFRYTDNVLHFSFPLISGSRSSALSFFPVEKGEQNITEFNKEIDKIAEKGGKHKSEDMAYRYSQLLHQQYASLSLDRIKDWELEYAENMPRPENQFPPKVKSTPTGFYNDMVTSAMAYYPMGLNFYPGIHSIEHRIVYSNLIESYLCHYKSLSEEQRKTVEALFILGGYVNMLEEMNAIRTSLAGTANMAADGWSMPMQVSFLFPEHPMAKEWGDFFEKSLEIYGLFYTRPDVEKNESSGGRWVESLGVYNWAYLRPTGHSNIASVAFDGKNRFANPYMPSRGRWMVDMLTAPVYNYKNSPLKYNGSYPDNWKVGDALSTELGFGRQYPAHGAHGGGITVDRPASLFEFGEWMRNYDPVLAENIFWTGKAGGEIEHKEGQSDWVTVVKKQYPMENNGTNPHLKSCKYTGHGIVLRAGVDTPEELSIHLEQVDKGPNYRWGHQAQGNSGGLYFYAQGQIFTGHENEIAGDHTANNLDGLTNFGVIKNGEYRTIGMNELKSPLYDFGIAQFAEITSDSGKDKYAWPEYLSRSIMLVGNDYFLIYDQTGTNWRAFNRFSWFTAKGHEYPDIVFLSKSARPDHWTTGETANSRGFYRDSENSLLTFVSHKKGDVTIKGGKIKTQPFMKTDRVGDFIPEKGYNMPTGVVVIETSNSTDVVFRNEKVITYKSEKESFIGEAGVIRKQKDGELHMALFKGNQIAADGLTLDLTSSDGQKGAVSVVRHTDGRLSGKIKAEGKILLKIKGAKKGGNVYLNGSVVNVKLQDGAFSIEVDKGEYSWEYTTTDAIPQPSKIVYTEYGKKEVDVYIEKPSNIKKVRIDVSTDGGKIWKSEGYTSSVKYSLPNGTQNSKIHVRVVSVNGKSESLYAPEYPVYFTDEAPHYPEGLWLKTDNNKITLSWGEVLGVQKYRLYRRKIGTENFDLIYEGRSNRFTDNNALGAIPPYKLPGSLDNRNKVPVSIYEYYVTSVNGNGEGKSSPVESSDPASWRNWYPDTELKFKRQSAFWMPPYVYPHMSPEKYYEE